MGADPEYAGVVPIPQDDGLHPLAQIAYSPQYAEAMSYLRALMVGDGEMSERALKLTGNIIAMNPAHYTVWFDLSRDIDSRAYRARILFSLHTSLVKELDFLDNIAQSNPKNYQIYHHRQSIVEEMSKRDIADFSRELDFTEKLIMQDQKNYHVWSYR
jgi:protein farnesyltransferase/geranylgeranyltransferase type-1 subunit alpha